MIILGQCYLKFENLCGFSAVEHLAIVTDDLEIASVI